LDKAHLRNLVKKQRTQLSPKELQLISEKVMANLEENFDFSKKITNLFLPIEKFHEIDLFPMIDLITAKGGEVCLNTADFSAQRLHTYLYENKEQIKISPYGIPEPMYGAEVDVSKIDIIIVPLLAFNDKGYRVGYGKGFYDNYLIRCSKKCVFIGVNHFNEMNEIEDIRAQDVPLHFIVTPKKIYTFPG